MKLTRRRSGETLRLGDLDGKLTMSWKRLLAALVALMAVATANTAPISAGGEAGAFGVMPYVVTTVAGAEISTEARQAAARPRPVGNAYRANLAVPGEITVVYLNPAMPPQVKIIFDAAIAEWDRVLQLSPNAPVEIAVDWRDLGNPSILGTAGPNGFARGFTGLPPGQFVAMPLANVMTNSDLRPDGPEIIVNFNSAFPNWHLGLDAPPGTQHDLFTVALHELGHGFGFTGTLSPTGFRMDFPTAYDLNVFLGNTPVTELADPGAAVTGGNLEIDVVNQGRFKIYAPNSFEQGSSYSHFDEATFSPGTPASLMTPQLSTGEFVRALATPVIGVMETIGWPLESTGGAPGELQYFPTNPCRLEDTRQTTTLVPNETRAFTVIGRCNIPADAAAVDFVVTAVNPAGSGFVRMGPGTFTDADFSATILNYTPFINATNAVAVQVGAGAAGDVKVRNYGSTSHLVIDMTGYWAPASPVALRYTSNLCRLADTRATSALVPDEVRAFDVLGLCGIPSDASAVDFVITAVDPASNGFMRMGAGNIADSQLNATILNYSPFLNASNAVAVQVGAGPAGDVKIRNFGSTSHVVIDVSGYWSPSSSNIQYYPANPCRLADTRQTNALAGGEARAFTVRGRCEIPLDATAVDFVLTAVDPAGNGFMRMGAGTSSGDALTATLLNYSPYLNATNAVAVPVAAGAQGDVIVKNFQTLTHLVIDMTGYWAPGPEAQSVSFGSGTWAVGAEVPADTYRNNNSSGGCYWARLSGFGGTVDEIIANEFTSDIQIVTIAASDAGFQTSQCGTWSNDLSPRTSSPTSPFGGGDYQVGTEVSPTRWRNNDSSDFCYWERLSGFSGTLGDVISNGFTEAIRIVDIGSGDVGFSSEDCGTWSTDLTPRTASPVSPFGAGSYLVGSEVAPGLWRNDDSSDSCYWARLTGFSGDLTEIITNSFSTEIQTVAIGASDEGFESSNCGTWTKVA